MAKTPLVLICLGIWFAWPVPLGGAKDQPAGSPPAPIKVSVDEMVALHGKNTVAADQKFVNREVELTGVFRPVSRRSANQDGPSEYTLALSPSEGSDDVWVACYFDRETAKPLAALEAGHLATIRGICRADNRDKPPFVIEDCKLITASATPSASVKRQRWEYKLVEAEYKADGDGGAGVVTKKLNELGSEGWEYVGQLSAFSRKRGESPTISLLFKRRK